MQFGMGVLIGASLGCAFGYVLGAIMRMGKQADVMGANLQSARLEQIKREPELPLAVKRSAARRH
jgi:hypothetical protein